MQAEGTIVTMTKQVSSTAGRQKGRLQLLNRSTQTPATEESREDQCGSGGRFQECAQVCHKEATSEKGAKTSSTPASSMDRDSHSEDTLSTMVLENIKNKLIHAFRTTGESREDPQESGNTVRPVSIGRSHQANEELRRAQIDGAITWLRSELVGCSLSWKFATLFFVFFQCLEDSQSFC